MIVARKEFSDHVRSARLLILVGLVALAAIAAVFAASGGIRDAADQASGSPSLFLRLFTLTGERSRLPSYSQLIALMGPLFGIAFGFDAINGERAEGTLPRLLSQPIHRDDVVNGKFAAGLAVIGAVLVGLTAMLGAVGLIRLGIVPGFSDLIRLLAWLVLSIMYVGFWLALATLASVWVRRAATSALISFAAWLVATLFAFLLVGIVADFVAPVGTPPSPDEQLANARAEQTLSRLSPATLYEESTGVLLNPQVRATGIIFAQQLDRAIPTPLPLDQSLLVVWPQVTGIIGLTLLTFLWAYVRFMRQEIRS